MSFKKFDKDGELIAFKRRCVRGKLQVVVFGDTTAVKLNDGTAVLPPVGGGFLEISAD